MGFQAVPGMRSLNVSVETLVSVIRSLNQISLAVPGHDTENAEAYVIGLGTPTGAFVLYVYILLTQSGTPVIYASDGPPVASAQFAALESEAVAFIESMGFMSENLNFRRQPPESQAAMLAGFPFCQRNPPSRPSADELEEISGELLEAEPAAVMSPDRRRALSRVLSSY